MAEALRKIPDPSPVIDQQQQATGTDGKPAEPGDHQQSSATSCQPPQLPYNAVVGDDWRRLATIGDKLLSGKNLRPSTQVGYGELQKSPGNSTLFKSADHSSDQLPGHLLVSVPINADLLMVIAAWPTLPAPVVAGIAAMVRAAMGCSKD